MLPRRLRLSRNAFALARTPLKRTSAHFGAAVGKAQVGERGCAAIVSKKVARLATTRHRLKRRMLSVMRMWCTKDAVLMVYARAGSAALPFSTLKAELSELLERLFATL